MRTERLRKMQLRRYEGYIQEKVDTSGRQHWFVPMGRMSDSGTFHNLKYCPKCLKDKAFFKRHWRLLFVNVCPQHQVYLMCKCPSCGESVDLSKICPLFPVTMCLCGFNLKNAEPIKAREKEVVVAKRLIGMMQRGYFELDGRWHYSIGFFHVLRIVVTRVIVIERKRQKKVDWIYEYDVRDIKYIEEMDPQSLAHYLGIAYRFLSKEWSDGFLKFCKTHKLTNKHAILDKYRYDIDMLPKWFLDGLVEVIEVSNPKCDEELQAMFEYCEKHRISTLREIGDFCGYSLNHVFLLKRKYLKIKDKI